MLCKLSYSNCTQKYAHAKFVAHSEGEIGVDNLTGVKMNIFLTKIGAISIKQHLDSYCRYLMQEVTVL